MKIKKLITYQRDQREISMRRLLHADYSRKVHHRTQHFLLTNL